MLMPAIKYMGSKVKAIKPIMKELPEDIDEYREPFIGGGSTLLGMLQCHKKPNKIEIGDMDYDVYNFWYQLLENTQELIDYSRCKLADLDTVVQEGMVGKTGVEAASIYLILNHLRMYGNCGNVSESIYGEGYVDGASTIESILASRIWGIRNIVGKANIRMGDYEWAFTEPTDKEHKDTLIFLDPPYMNVSKPYYLGHSTFDFNRLLELLKSTKHKFIMTIDKNSLAEAFSKQFNIVPYQIYYGSSHRYVTELIVKNY